MFEMRTSGMAKTLPGRSRLVGLVYKALEGIEEPLAHLRDSEVLGVLVRAFTRHREAYEEHEAKQRAQSGRPAYEELDSKRPPGGEPEGH